MREPDLPPGEPRGFRLGSIAGTSIHVEISFLVVVALFVILALEEKVPPPRALLWIPILFLSVLLHEAGHAVAIALFGFGPSRIALSGFGGVTVNQRESRGWKEIVISVAGPLTSLGLAMLAALLSKGSLMRDPMMASLLPLMAWANRSWAIFNMIPIYPLDGGQVLRNLCRLMMRERRALLTATAISLALTVALAIYALLNRMMFLTMLSLLLLSQNYQVWKMIRGQGRP